MKAATSQEEVLKVKAVMMLGAACHAKLTDEKGRPTPEATAEINMWRKALEPYPAVVVQGAVVGWIHDTKQTFHALPAIGAITERIELILSMDRRRRFKAAQARRQTALAEHLGRRREALRVYLGAMRNAAKLPPAEATAARIVAGQAYAASIAAIDRAISIAASSENDALEARHG